MLPHVENIKYKGFHPIAKRKTVQNINSMINKFNEQNIKLSEYIVTENLLQSVNETIVKMFPEHRNYLLRYIKFAMESIRKQNEKLRKAREKNFKRIINNLVSGSRQTLKQKNNKIFEWYTENKNEFDIEVANIEEMVKYQIDKLIVRVTILIEKRQNDKIQELIIKSNEWIKDLENKLAEPGELYFLNPEQKNNAEKILISLQDLKDVLEKKNGKFSFTTISTLQSCFGRNRIWMATEKALNGITNITYPPINNSDKSTNGIVLCLLGIITDNGSHPSEIIETYIKSK